MKYISNHKINNIALKVILSLLQILSFLNIYSIFYNGEYVNDFVSLILLLVELIVLLNLADFIKGKSFLFEFGLLSIILFIRLNILNGYFKFEADKYVGIIFVLISMLVHIYIIRCIDDNFKKENRALRNDEVSDVEIEKYVRNKILNFFRLAKAENNNSDTPKYIWIAFSGLIAIVLFLGKFIIDIKNIFSTEYTFGTAIIVIYVILNTVFIIVNYIKSKIIRCNKIIDFVETILFLLGANLFVFAQREYARFQILVAAAYLCSLYILKTKNWIKKLEDSKKIE